MKRKEDKLKLSTRAENPAEPTPPKQEGTQQLKGNALRVNWIKQDDGGSPITHYLVRYKAVSIDAVHELSFQSRHT